MLELIADLVQVESPTEDPAAVNRCVRLVEKWLRQGGGKSKRSRQSAAGDLLVGHFGPVRPTLKPLRLSDWFLEPQAAHFVRRRKTLLCFASLYWSCCHR